jgi:hypothetical protein
VDHSPWGKLAVGTSCPPTSKSRDSRRKRMSPYEGKTVAIAFAEDGVDWRIDIARLAVPFAVV